MKDLTYEGFRRVGLNNGERTSAIYVRDKVDHYWIADNLQEEYIEEFIIHFGGESDELSEEESSKSESDGRIGSDGE